MKKLALSVLALSVLSGCAVAPPAAPYISRVVQDPYQWHTVSVEPVGAVRIDRQYGGDSVYVPQAEYSSRPVYVQPPVYMAPPLYAPAPAYYYPPVTIGLDFVFGNWCCGGRGGHHYSGRPGRRR